MTRSRRDPERRLLERARRLIIPLEKTEHIDEKSLREKGIGQLLKAVDVAYEILVDSKIDLRTRQGWFREHTNAVLALNQILKDRQDRDWTVD